MPPYPSWFKDWIDAERHARIVRTWEPIIIPGLLQTPDYARALFRAWQTAENTDETERLAAARMDRQCIFDPRTRPR
jgi:Domain of unknown function (DUF5753)